ncbi:MAG TPA: cbb3-type cytochrome c oxidase subunit I [Terriglobia bacterium]|nr:cbb3-type cytochrome c oxidase subunit I [Terriglobia bacterium]
MGSPAIGKVRIEEIIGEDPALVRLIYKYLVWATVWLIFATALGLLLSLKLSYPDLLDFSFTSYGRVRPIHTNALFWGWTSMAMVALCLFVVPRTSRTQLHSLTLARVALWMWNVAVAAGTVALAMGINNGDQEYREYVWPIMAIFAAGMLVHLYNFLCTVREREIEEIYISNWYIIAALIWTTTLVTVGYLPWYQHGLAQANIQGYYMHQGVGMWFTPVVLGLTYYFLPKFLNRPIYSYSLGVLAFWTQLVFYTLIGAHHFIFSAIPWWIQTIAIVFSVGMMVPVWAGTGNFILTMRGKWRTIGRSYSLPFILAGAVCYGLVSTQGTFESFRWTNLYWHFTNFTIGHSHFTMYGFVAFLIWGGVYGLLPRLTGREPSIVAVGVHFWFSMIGMGIYVVALSIGGTIQGTDWVRLRPFIDSVTDMAPYWLWRSVGGTLMFLSHVIFAYNLYKMRPRALGEATPEVARA